MPAKTSTHAPRSRARPDAEAVAPATAGAAGPPRRARGRPTAAAAAQLREDFIRAALDCFLARGYAGTSIDSLARESSVHKDTIYRLYGDKETIYLAAIALGMQQLRERLASIRLVDADPKTVLRSFILRIHEEMTTPLALSVMRLVIAEAQQFPDVAERLFDDCGGNLDALADYLASLKKAGTIDIADPMEAANQLSLYAVDGVRFLMTGAPSTRAQQLAHARKVLDFLLRAWRARF